jgi:hypothetical protein
MRLVVVSCLLLTSVLTGVVALASRTEYTSVKRKFTLIEKYQVKPGTRVPFPASELNAYVQAEIPKVAPQGIRNPHLELPGGNVAVGTALINFVKVQNAQGNAPGWFARKLLDGEHNVVVTARLESGNGMATVDLKRVEIDGITVQGAALDFLIQNYLLPNYPDAKVGKPFALDYRMDRFEVNPGIAYVVMKH